MATKAEAKNVSKRTKSKKSKSSAIAKKKRKVDSHFVGEASAELQAEAFRIEAELESELLLDAVMSAKAALEQLRADLHGPPNERRRGIRLRDNSIKVERAFNRLRALRMGTQLPERHPDD